MLLAQLSVIAHLPYILRMTGGGRALYYISRYIVTSLHRYYIPHIGFHLIVAIAINTSLANHIIAHALSRYRAYRAYQHTAINRYC
jgi:hypothetical protein